jgi:hypothetical protein
MEDWPKEHKQGFAPVVIPAHLKIDVCLACTSIDMGEVSLFWQPHTSSMQHF